MPTITLKLNTWLLVPVCIGWWPIQKRKDVPFSDGTGLFDIVAYNPTSPIGDKMVPRPIRVTNDAAVPVVRGTSTSSIAAL